MILKAKTALIFVVTCLAVPSASFAMLPTIDLMNIAQTTTTALNSVKTVVNQARQIQNQIASVKNQYMSLKNQAQGIQNQVKNLKNIKKLNWQNLSGYINQIDSLTMQGNAIAATMKNADKAFTKRFPDYINTNMHVDYQSAYKNWSGTTLATLKNTLLANGHAAKHSKDENTLLQSLKAQCKTAEGRMQALQITSEISAENVNQLQSLKRLVVSQTNSQNAYMAYKVSKDSYEEKSLDDVVKQLDTSFPVYQNNSALGEIRLTT